jgi:hypothetical protein
MDSWSVGAGFDRGTPVVVTVNEEYVSREARANCTVCVSLVLKELLPAITAEKRSRLEDELCAFFDACGGHLVAKIASSSQYKFIFYAPENAVDPAAVPVPAGLIGICTVFTESDPEWSEYESWITDEKIYEEHDRSIMAELGSIGDTFELPRDVDFLWKFRTKDDGDESITLLRAAGIRVERINETTLKTVANMGISLEGLRDFRNAVLSIIAARGGSLQFWGCYPMTVDNR